MLQLFSYFSFRDFAAGIYFFKQCYQFFDTVKMFTGCSFHNDCNQVADDGHLYLFSADTDVNVL